MLPGSEVVEFEEKKTSFAVVQAIELLALFAIEPVAIAAVLAERLAVVVLAERFAAAAAAAAVVLAERLVAVVLAERFAAVVLAERFAVAFVVIAH